MTRMRKVGITLAALVVGHAASGMPGALAASAGNTIQGEPFVTGGVGESERKAMQDDRGSYSLFIQTAAKTGPFVTDAVVTITDRAGKRVLETTMTGPWMLVNLKLGEYAVAVVYGGQSQVKKTTIHGGDHHEMVFYFDEKVERLPKGERP